MTILSLNWRILFRLARLVFIVEPLIPFFVYVSLTIEFLRLKKAGLVVNYRIRARRLGKFYYGINVRMTLNSRRIGGLLVSQFFHIFETLMRGIFD